MPDDGWDQSTGTNFLCDSQTDMNFSGCQANKDKIKYLYPCIHVF